MPLYPSDLHTASCELSIITSWFPSGEQHTLKEHCEGEEKKNIKKYFGNCHFLLNTQSQTQAVIERLHCLLKSAGSSSVSGDFWDRFVPKDAQMLWLMNRNSRGVQRQGVPTGGPQRKEADAQQRNATRARSLPTISDRTMTVLNQHALLLPLCTVIAFMSKNVFTDCVALKQQNNRDCKRQQWARVSTCWRFPKDSTLKF